VPANMRLGMLCQSFRYPPHLKTSGGYLIVVARLYAALPTAHGASRLLHPGMVRRRWQRLTARYACAVLREEAELSIDHDLDPFFRFDVSKASRRDSTPSKRSISSADG
jgi:hypothetical protein